MMKYSKLIFLGIFLVSAFFSGCQSLIKTENTNTISQPIITVSETKDDIDEFEKIARLPFYPEDVVWQETTVENSPNGNGKKIRAILLFKQEDYDKLMAQPDKQKPAGNLELEAEKWFPDELVARSDFSGDRVLKGILYPAESFLAEPFKKGVFMKIDGTEFFILDISTF
jgi:hypothetical protein